MVKRDNLTVSPSRQGVGVEMRNGYSDEEPRGKKRYPHRESSSSRGGGGDKKWTLWRGTSGSKEISSLWYLLVNS